MSAAWTTSFWMVVAGSFPWCLVKASTPTYQGSATVTFVPSQSAAVTYCVKMPALGLWSKSSSRIAGVPGSARRSRSR